jgi:chromosome segregation ATPase
MTIQTYKAIQGGYVPSDDGPVVFKTDYLREIEHYQSDDRGKTNEINILTKENRALTAALAEKERSVHEKYKAELITQNDQLDRYEEQIAALQDAWRKAHEKTIAILPKHPDPQINRIRAEVGPANTVQNIEDIGHYIAALTARIKELEEEVTNAVEIAKMELIEAALGGKV